jgi:DNA replication ATP-dependent helicase Dna2
MPNDKTPIVNVKKLAQAVKSSNADPTLELWDRYSMAGTVAPLDISNPALAQILASSSSPRPPRTANSLNGEPSDLRRSLSCRQTGNKRRRVLGSEASPLASKLDNLDVETSKSSLLNSLLDTVHTSIQDASVSPEPESPSPQKKTQRMSSSPTVMSSPSRPASRYGGSETRQIAAFVLPANEPAFVTSDSKNPTHTDPAPPSDYGDDDFDDDVLVELAETIVAAATQPPNDEPRPPQPPSRKEEKANVPEVRADSEYADADLDDDTLFDLLDGDLDNPVLFGNPTITKSNDDGGEMHELPTTTPSLKQERGGADDFDEFGDDDFGNDFDYEAVQSSCGVKSSLPVVRAIWPG